MATAPLVSQGLGLYFRIRFTVTLSFQYLVDFFTRVNTVWDMEDCQGDLSTGTS